MNKLLNLSVVPAQPCSVDFAWYDEIRANLLHKTVNDKGRVLDVGCGRDDVLFILYGQIWEGIGIDISQTDLDRAESE